MQKLSLVTSLCALVLTPLASLAMSEADFEDLVWGMAGGGDPVYRVSTGLTYDTETGRVLELLEGHQISLAVPSKGEPGTIYQVARTFLLHRDPKTGAVNKVYPSADPNALTGVSAYSLEDGAVVWRLGNTETGAPRAMPNAISCARQGPVLACQRGTSYGPEGPDHTLLEYRWLIHRDASAPEAAARMEFVETEAPPGGMESGTVLLRMSSYRVADWGSVPERLRGWVETEATSLGQLPEDIPALIEAAGFTP